MKKYLKASVFAFIFALLFPMLGLAEDAEAVSGFYATFWALVPPVVAIGLALITKAFW